MTISTERPWDSDGGALPKTAEHARADDTGLWYALQIRPRYEKKTDALLRSKGFETFLPLVSQIHQWSDRRKRICSPLFPGYEFVRLRLSVELRKAVLQTGGVVSFIGTQYGPTSVPRSQVEGLQQLLRAGWECGIRPFLHSGQRVRVRGGALDGIVGTLLSDSRKHLVISFECLQQSISVVIDGYDLELI